MRRYVPVFLLLLASTGLADAHGLLIPEERSIPPLAMLNHQVTITMEDQVSVTRVEQTFRNHTDRQLEATYLFPVPKGASVNKFTMWVNGKEVSGEMLEAAKARQIYTDIVSRTKDPGLLEYMDNHLLRMKVFPILPKSDQKVAISYTAMAAQDAGAVEYIYPLKTDGKATSTLQEFSIQATIKSQHPIQNIYSPTHAIAITRPNDHEAVVKFEKNQAWLDKDFQLFYATGDKDIGFTTLMQRPISSEKGFFLAMISPRLEMSKSQTIPRDMVMVLDTSGSMRGPKMDQARRALKYCLSNLNPGDRFGVMNFATTVNRYRDSLVDSSSEQVEQAKKWVDALEATGGTAINDALAAALEMRGSDSSRTLTIVFFTDGMPTVGETNVDRIMKNVMTRNTANTRIFTFGVGDDVNATFLDQLAEQTRAVSTYVRPAEDIEAKVSSLYTKISHPVLANLKLTASNDVRLEEIYPPQLPDLFHGGQLVVLGRYNGKGPAAITLNGMVGSEPRNFVYELTFPDKTKDEKGFVEHLWARRKVGYLLDQIRANGESKELVQETVALAKKYGIATPYTSYLVVPDGPVPVARAGAMPNVGFGAGGPSSGFNGGFGGGLGLGGAGAMRGANSSAGGKTLSAPTVMDLARAAQSKPGELSESRAKLEDAKQQMVTEHLKDGAAKGGDAMYLGALREAGAKKRAYDEAHHFFLQRDKEKVQGGQLGVDLSVDANNLRNQSRLTQTALRQVAGRNCLEYGGVWIDEDFDAKMPSVVVKAQSAAYFRILERQPQVKEVFKLGNQLVWVTPNRTALVIDTNDGKDKLTDEEIDKLFVAKK
ncbi:MAG TPA: VIT domain-containing protein [Gemmataceae bacterium]|jgi:Ca-activated chloride channel family protein|nr:VIT domain-containing protein [Gemmataceae bacterium]